MCVSLQTPSAVALDQKRKIIFPKKSQFAKILTLEIGNLAAKEFCKSVGCNRAT